MQNPEALSHPGVRGDTQNLRGWLGPKTQVALKGMVGKRWKPSWARQQEHGVRAAVSQPLPAEMAGVGREECGTGCRPSPLPRGPAGGFLSLWLLLAAGLQDGHDGVGDVCLLGKADEGALWREL